MYINICVDRTIIKKNNYINSGIVINEFDYEVLLCFMSTLWTVEGAFAFYGVSHDTWMRGLMTSVDVVHIVPKNKVPHPAQKWTWSNNSYAVVFGRISPNFRRKISPPSSGSKSKSSEILEIRKLQAEQDSCLIYFSTLKMEAMRPSETSVDF
jgi:hypothetical protein